MVEQAWRISGFLSPGLAMYMFACDSLPPGSHSMWRHLMRKKARI